MSFPILCLHGALATKLQFTPLTQLLEPNFKVHSLNFSGHGGNLIPPQGLSFDTFANDILTYLNANNLDKVNLLGYSMGGYAALYFTYKYPQMVNKIVTVNVKFNWDPISTAKETGMLNPDKMLEKIPAFANNLMVQHGLNIWKNLLSSTSEMLTKLSETVVLSKTQLAEIKHPVLLCVGDRDTTSSIAETMQVYKELDHAYFMVLPNTPHSFEKINLKLLNEALLGFYL